jgi:hypothetical protein
VRRQRLGLSDWWGMRPQCVLLAVALMLIHAIVHSQSQFDTPHRSETADPVAA